MAIVGLPNAGKSQLLNLLLKAPLAAVSRKRHTTREGLFGAYNHTTRVENSNDEDENENASSTTTIRTQLMFVDTPGFLTVDRARREGLDRSVMGTAKAEIAHVDYTILVIDAAANFTDTVKKSIVELMVKALEARGRVEVVEHFEDEERDTAPPPDPTWEPHLPDQKFAVVLNKVDLVYPKPQLLNIAMEIGDIARQCLLHHKSPDGDTALPSNAAEDDEALLQVLPTFFYTDALRNDGVDDLREFLLRKATPSQQFDVEEGTCSNMEPEERAEEIIREKLYRQLHKEVPHSIRQKNRLFHIGKNANGDVAVVIRQDLLVQTKSHQQLVLGSLERIQKAAQRDLQVALHCEVRLHLNIKLARSAAKRWSI